MEKINKDIYMMIWSYVGSKTLLIMPESERIELMKLKNSFKNNPLKFHYQLIKWKRIITNKPVRATMKVENEKVYLLKGKVNIQIKNNKVIIKDNSKYNIIPRRKIITSSIPGRNYQIIWDIYKSRVDNIKRARLYLIFWNNY